MGWAEQRGTSSLAWGPEPTGVSLGPSSGQRPRGPGAWDMRLDRRQREVRQPPGQTAPPGGATSAGTQPSHRPNTATHTLSPQPVRRLKGCSTRKHRSRGPGPRQQPSASLPPPHHTACPTGYLSSSHIQKGGALGSMWASTSCTRAVGEEPSPNIPEERLSQQGHKGNSQP